MGQAGTNGCNRSLPPFLSILLGPAGLRVRKRIFHEGRGYYVPIFCREDCCFDTGGAQVYSQKCLHLYAPFLYNVSLHDAITVC
jgi:hypothetical protein